MSDTAQIVGTSIIVFLMLIALYGVEHRKESNKPFWIMCVALLIGMVIF